VTTIRAKAPLRVSFAGGGTDVAPYPELEGGAVLSATIDRFAYGTLCPRTDGKISVESVDFGLAIDFGVKDSIVLDGKLDLVKAAIRRHLDREEGGYDLFLHTGAPPGTGLGSSSTVIVALVGLLMKRYNLALTDYDIAELAYVIEREDLGIRGGLQDHYAATFGGFNYIEFDKDQVLVNPLRVSDATVWELEHNLLLCYTGMSRSSTQILEDQTERMTAAVADTLEGLRMQKRLASEMKSALLRGRHDEFGELLGHAWSYKKMMSPKISTAYIDEIYDVARREGAIGGKVTGAGGGGHMLLYCDFRRKHRVAEAILGLGASVSELSFETRGLTTWRA